jgi:hypothetical protein
VKGVGRALPGAFEGGIIDDVSKLFEKPVVRCPFCAEPIRPEAKISPHCRQDLGRGCEKAKWRALSSEPPPRPALSDQNVTAAHSGIIREESVISDNSPRWPCPFCAELIKIEAKICPHCRSTLPAVDLAILEKQYPEVYRHYRYKREGDGSVLLATPSGPLRFKNWSEFWRAVN